MTLANTGDKPILLVRSLGRQPYQPIYAAMQNFTNTRDHQTQDEFWWLEHEPVFTQGQAGKASHLLMPGDIPVVQADRGGQITYHGPGQMVGYALIDIKRLGIGVRDLVSALEKTMITCLECSGIHSYARPDAPGVYVKKGDNHLKIGSLGIRIRRGCSYHGLSLNVDMDLAPFLRINPCGHPGLEITQMKNLIGDQKMPSIKQLQTEMTEALASILGYHQVEYQESASLHDALQSTIGK